MKLLSILLFSIFSSGSYAASCCVSNTSVSNLMILPATWQETLTLSHSKVIGDVDYKGSSTFRRKENKDTTQLAKLDLAYGWNSQFQSGVSVKYQNKNRNFNGSKSSDAGWSDLGVSSAYRPKSFDRLWFFQTLNIPTATSIYNSRANYSVDAHGSGTYQTSLGFFGIKNFKEWDVIYSSEVHHSFGKTFKKNNDEIEVGSFWGNSLTLGGGYIPWRSKARYGIALTPRLEGPKEVISNGTRSRGKESIVWDTSLNYTYTFNAEYALGVNYLDQTFFGPAKNTLLNRSISFLFQTRWL